MEIVVEQSILQEHMEQLLTQPLITILQKLMGEQSILQEHMEPSLIQILQIIMQGLVALYLLVVQM